MKRLFLLLMLPLLAITLNSCSKKDDGVDNVNYNKFIINGQNYEFRNGYMTYYGYDNEHNNLKDMASIEVYLGYESYEDMLNDEDGATGVEITFNIPKKATKLLAGTYPFKSWKDGEDLIFTCTEGFADEDGDEYYFNGGTVIVAVSGSTYTIQVDCTLDNGGKVKGTYKGTLNWYDESK